MSTSALYVVATPIGHMDDLSPRARSILGSVDLIAAEDTRRAGLLLSKLGIKPSGLVSYYDQIEDSRAPQLVKRMKDEGISIALISDAGSPCIADPGYRLVRQARDAGIAVHPIPGPSAVTSLVSVSGLACHRFLFIGFLPTKDGAFHKEMESWKQVGGSVIFYESPRRLAKSLEKIATAYPGVRLAIGREMTKLHEEIVTMAAEDAILWAQNHENLKGEAAVMVDLSQMEKPSISTIEDLLTEDLNQGLTFKDILKKYKDDGYSKSELYQKLIELKNGKDA